MKTRTFRTGGHFIAATLLVAVSASTIFYSCKKETEEQTPAYFLAESEKLVIPASIELPANLPKGNTRIATYYAEGVQKYVSRLVPGSIPATYEWVFVAPEADLFDASNNKVGTHGAGPHWRLSGGIDSIYAQSFNPPKYAFSPDPNSIDWLQLMPKTGKAPTGIFSNVNFVQRIATSGGKKPSGIPTSEGQVVNVKYSAVYRFSKQNQ